MRSVTSSKDNVARNGEKPECRILMVFATLGMGGAETWLIALLRYLKENADALPLRLKIDICLTGSSPGLFDNEAIGLGARLFRLPYSRKTLWAFVKGFRRLLKAGRYDAIHDHQDYTAGWHFMFGWGLLPKVRIAHVHNPAMNLQFFASSILRRCTLSAGRRLLARLASHILGTSRQVIAEYEFQTSLFRNVVTDVVHCGFDVSQYKEDYCSEHRNLCSELALSASSKIVLFVGRLSSNCNQKNPQFAIDVLGHCVAQNPEIRLLIAGGGDQEIAQLNAQVKERALDQHIFLLGERHDVPKLMCGSHLLLFPSVAEGLGMVAVEAQAAGLPVLASTGVPRECNVVDEIVTFLPLSEGPAIWASMVERLLEQRHPSQHYCNAAVQDSPFSIENSAQRLLEIYRNRPQTMDEPLPSGAELITSRNG